VSQTIIGSAPISLPFKYVAPLIELQQTWGDGWIPSPHLQCISMTINASSVQPSELIFAYIYGPNVKQAADTNFGVYTSIDLTGWWVRVSFFDQNGKPQPQAVFQVEAPSKELLGGVDSMGNPIAAGRITYLATDPLRTLQRIRISESVFWDEDSGDYNTVGWVPAMNKRDKRGMLVGNASGPDGSGDYYYGGTSPAWEGDPGQLWTREQYAEYILNNWVQQDDGPAWFIVGQTDVLDAITDSIDMPQTATAAEVLKMLIDPQAGVDFNVQYSPADDAGNAEGFQVNVFALSSAATTFGDATMPANPNKISINRTNQIDLSKTTIVSSAAKRVDMVKVLGKRIVVCGTLYGDNAVGGDSDANSGSLENLWSDSLESDYISANGISDPVNADYVRRREKYRDVYQAFGAPSDWDLDGGAWNLATDYQGKVQQAADYQTVVRRTLPWIPLQQGFDYTKNPPTDNTDGESQPDTSPPIAWLYSKDVVPFWTGYIQAEHYGHGVSPHGANWGAWIHSSPNHRKAKNQWTAAQLETTVNVRADGTPVVAFDWTQTVLTIAIESDHRMGVVWQVPSNMAAGDGSEMIIEDNEAEMWLVKDGTIVDTDSTGTLVSIASSNQGKPIEIRNDIPRLQQIMAGVINRYTNDRARARITWKTFQPWGYMVGQILDVYQSGDDTAQIGAIITSITWRAPPSEGGEPQGPEMEVLAGYA